MLSMSLIKILIISSVLLLCVSYNFKSVLNLSRFKLHDFDIKRIATSSIIALSLITPIIHAQPAIAQVTSSTDTKSESVYFGVGCFWHVQHEFVETERRILGRSDSELTSVAGYAGGKQSSTNRDDLVCYHNMLGIGDYGQKGYGEVVGLTIPTSKLIDFAEEYFSLFGSDNERPDKGDRGAEYRSLIGLPGGVNNELYPEIKNIADKRGLTLKIGEGNDADTLFKKTVWVMDTATYPFKQAEIYHQYHDGFMINEQYPQSYNVLVKEAIQQGRIKPTGCPDKSREV